MPVFRIHRMKDAPRQQFRVAPHVSGSATARPKDYELPLETEAQVDAENEYAAWALLRGSAAPLHVGDLLELPTGELRICRYVGFDEARWFGMDTAAEPLPGTPVPSAMTPPAPAPASPATPA